MGGFARLAVVLVCACSATVGTQGATDAGGDNDPDATVEPDAETLGAWGTPTLVPGASTGVSEDDGSMSSPALEVVFSAIDPADNNKHLYYMVRTTKQDPFGPAIRLPFNVTNSTDQTPRFSADDLTLYFASNRDPNTTGLDVYQVTRPSVGGTFGTPSLVAGIDDPAKDDKWCMLCAGNRYLMISNRAGGEDIYEGVLGMGAPVRVAELSSPQSETGTFLSQDCLTVHFASTRGGPNRLYTSTRTAIGMPWAPPTTVDDFVPLATENQEDPWLASDGRTFMFSSNKSGNRDVYLSTR